MPIEYEVVENKLQPGTYYPRVVAGDAVGLDHMLPNIVTKTALSATDVRGAISALIEEVTTVLADGRPVRLDGLCRFSMSLSETLTEPDAVVSPAVAVRVNARTDSALQGAVSAAARVSKTVRGLKKPVIVSYVDVASGARDRYAPASIGRISGDNLKLDASDAAQGVFFVAANGSETRAQVYSHIGSTRIDLLTPAGLSGTQGLVIRTRYSAAGGLRAETYAHELTAA